MTSKEVHITLLEVDAEPKRFTNSELYSCITREIALRISVYPNRVAYNRMTLENAKKEIAMMKTIRRLIELSSQDIHAKQNQSDLFKENEHRKPKT